MIQNNAPIEPVRTFPFPTPQMTLGLFYESTLKVIFSVRFTFKLLSETPPAFLGHATLGFLTLIGNTVVIRSKGLRFELPDRLEGAALKLRTLARRIRIAIYVQIPLFYASLALSKVKNIPSVVQPEVSSIDRYAQFVVSKALPMATRVVQVVTLVTALEVMTRLLLRGATDKSDLFVQGVIITQTGADVALLILKVAGITSGIFLFIEATELGLGIGLLFYEIFGYKRPENLLPS